MQFWEKFHVDFMGNRNIAFIISLVIIVIGIGSVFVKGGLNLGIEFVGGLSVEVRFSETPNIQDIRNAVEKAGFKGAVIQQLGEQSNVLIRVPYSAPLEGQSQEEAQNPSKQLASVFQSQFQRINFEILSVEQVGPQIGSELRQSAQLAILFSIAGMVLYIAWRFESKFALPVALIAVVIIGLSSMNVPISLVIIAGLFAVLGACLFFGYYYSFAAIMALIHDVLITVGAISLTNREITLPVIAAILTLIGYSINDTIVVFDRIRENLRLINRRSAFDVLNLSINQTMSRTILTGLTTLFVVAVLFFMGGAVINGFAFALFIGIITGTYSSIFVASAILYVWDHRTKGAIFRRTKA